MSVSSQISRIQTARNTIRAKLVGLGLAASTASLDACATAIEGIANKGAINAQVREGETYTIPEGYHNGSGVVSGVSGGGNYNLQEKSVTPTKKSQAITADSGYYGLSGVNVAAIPENYQDVSSTTAAAGDVLTGKVFVQADGSVATGTMPDNGTVAEYLSENKKSYTIPAGKHSGSGKVSVSTETKSATPKKTSQIIAPTNGKLLSRVNVLAIPDEYQDVTGVTATADTVLIGSDFVNAAGDLVNGAMPNNGAISELIDGLTVTSVTIPAGHTTGGTVSLTSDIEDALAAI